VVATDIVDDDYYFIMMNRITIQLENATISRVVSATELANFSDIISGTQYLPHPAFSRFTIAYTARDNANRTSAKVYD
jgi:Mg2+ and Co2+ transporter CorA